MAERRRRTLLALVAGVIVLLYAGRWGAGFAAERWWAMATAPAATDAITRWHLLRAGLELSGILVAGAWCVGHLLVVVRSIGTIQVPRRVGDLEIREALTPGSLTFGAVLLGLLLGALVGSGAGRELDTLLLAWHGVRYGVADPVLGLDAGTYIAQLPLWVALLDRATFLVWVAILLAVVLHPLVGSLRITQGRVAMTDPARFQVGGLVGTALAVAAVREGLAPLVAIGAARSTDALPVAPVVHWVVAICWGIGALFVLRWTMRPRPGTGFVALALWVGPGIASRIIVPMFGDAPLFDQAAVTRIAALGTGLDHLIEVAAPGDRSPSPPLLTALWTAERLVPTLEVDGGRVLALAPDRLARGRTPRPVWTAVRSTPGGIELVVVADDRLAADGGPVSYRAGDPNEYPGIVSWQRLAAPERFPGAPDTLRSGGESGILLGGTLRKLVLAWGTQTPTFEGERPDTRLHWRRGPLDGVSHLVPALHWSPARPVLDTLGALHWLVDGWAISPYSPFAPELPWSATERPRYLRPVVTALVPAEGGGIRLFQRADADPVGVAWGEILGPLVEPWERAPLLVRDGDLPPRWLALQGAALGVPPFADSLPRAPVEAIPSAVLVRAQGALEAQLVVSARGGEVEALLRGTQAQGRLQSTLLRWEGGGSAPAMPERYTTRWLRFASFERLRDSVVAAGGRVESGPVRYQTGPGGTVAVQVVYLVGPRGAAVVGWVNVGAGDRIGAARTPAAAWANLLGESTPIVPGPELPDRLHEARRWATLADSALRAGDLEGFGRAFEALKRVLAAP